jgi:hypothetical protein
MVNKIGSVEPRRHSPIARYARARKDPRLTLSGQVRRAIGGARANHFVFCGALRCFRLLSGDPLPPCGEIGSMSRRNEYLSNTRPLTGDILLPSPLIDALLCEIEAHAGHSNEADPAKHLEKSAVGKQRVLRPEVGNLPYFWDYSWN